MPKNRVHTRYPSYPAIQETSGSAGSICMHVLLRKMTTRAGQMEVLLQIGDRTRIPSIAALSGQCIETTLLAIPYWPTHQANWLNIDRQHCWWILGTSRPHVSSTTFQLQNEPLGEKVHMHLQCVWALVCIAHAACSAVALKLFTAHMSSSWGAYAHTVSLFIEVISGWVRTLLARTKRGRRCKHHPI